MKKNKYGRHFLVLLMSLQLSTQVIAAPDSPSEKAAFRVTKLFYASRFVIGENKGFSSDPTKFKGKEEYLKKQIKELDDKMVGDSASNSEPAEKILWSAINKVIQNAVDGVYKDEWKNSAHFPNQLIPARFALLVVTEFNKQSDTTFKLKWTTTDDYLVNPADAADAWETKTMSSKFKAADWKQGETFAEETILENQKVYRYMTPEYFKSSCMGCHGGTVGAQIHKSKTSAATGAFGGSLSFLIKIK